MIDQAGEEGCGHTGLGMEEGYDWLDGGGGGVVSWRHDPSVYGAPFIVISNYFLCS